MVNNVATVYDYLLPSKASLDIAGANGFSLNVQTFTIPAIYGHTAEQATPMYAVPLPGNKCIMDKLSVSFLVSENLESWLELHEWMMGIYQQ